MNAPRRWGRCLLIAAALWCAAGCGQTRRMTALVSMMADQELYFRNEMLPPFEKEHGAKIDVVHYGSMDSLETYLRMYAGKVGLVKVPFDRRATLIDHGLFKTLGVILSDAQLAAFKDDYLLTDLGNAGGQACLIPRKFETRIMVYSKSRVAEALGVWRKYRGEIHEEMKRYNGSGLPSNYYLDNDPNKWDYFDIFTLGWIWSHAQDSGKATGRIGLRGKRYSGTWLGIVDRVFQLGGDSSAVVSMTGDAVVDAFQWEAIYAASGAYNPGMWEQGWSGSDIWKAFGSGEVFLSFMTQLDCFFLHGTGRDNLTGYFKNPDDMGVAIMPSGCSAELNSGAVPVRDGKRSITTGGWWWGIPVSTPDAALSYSLATYITSTQSQIQECSRFGMIPVRKDVLGDMNMLFGGGWITDVYGTSFKQLMENGHTALPANSRIGAVGGVYLDAWYDIVAARNWSPDKTVPRRDHIKKLLETTYAPRAAKIVRGEQ